ncbi:serine hydrolase [Marinomonas mediterranea]|uniref:Beta-lactamase n=1 Tax=Marinomonas mediterranea (strain ATCC 700492 / JCM 21426 / NBRC 103028 / MMB-1) TaxID=717774 RepID=F2K310_MARM1|nr:serine hydrolase domain-containing protein [Marinomonas mediterranea]ADZ92399.1 beta-lactamase [Marinomonas mediterranea MMB-1]WCN14397.1 serine hydrolase [Marinomonas mediterranea]WCN18449.1 serine hydrolase [Marinomonas mediterranea MMB-1]
MKRATKLWNVIVTSLCVLSGCSLTPSKPDFAADQSAAEAYIQASLTWQMSETRRQHELASITTLLVDQDEVLFSTSQGYADLDEDLETGLDTPYRVGSITKVFTAIALLQLVDEGKVDIDAPLKRYLPEFNIHTSYGQELITIRRVLSHQSGLPSGVDKGFTRYAAIDDLVPILNETFVSFAPDVVFNYSNVGFTLLGLVIERVSGESYDGYLDKHVFSPLKLHQSFVGKQDVRLAHGYESLDEQELPEIRDIAAGDIAMSGHDLARFAQVLLNRGIYQDERGETRRLLSESSFNEMFSVQTDQSLLDSDLPIGLAWLLFSPVSTLSDMPSFAWHGGTTFFFHSSLMLNFELGIASVVLTNSIEGSDAVVEIGSEALALGYELKTGKPYLAHTEPTVVTKKLTTEREVSGQIVPFDESTLKQLEGRYFMPHVGEFSLVRSDSSKSMKVVSEFGELDVIRYSDDSFGVQYKELGFLPFESEELNQLRIEIKHYDDHLLLKERNGVVFAQKAPSLSPLKGNWRNALGQYRHVNPDEDLAIEHVQLREMDGYLIADLTEEGEKETIYFEVQDEYRAVSIGYQRDTKYSLILRSTDSCGWQLNYLGVILIKEVNDEDCY